MLGIKLDNYFILQVASCILTACIAGYVASNFLRRYSANKLNKKKRFELAKKKQQELLKLERKITADKVEHITNLKLEDLINEIQKGSLTPEVVLQAYMMKALQKDMEYNFITDINPHIEQDLASVKYIPDGLLKGIPVSIKESFCVRGCDSTFGILDQVFKPSLKDNTMVAYLRSLGMVPFVTTNVSQSGISMDSSNPIFGETLNPHNKSRSCGGSSCGEGAILSCGASIVGLGGDYGGSIRIPASFCGICGLKPTTNRFSNKNSKCNYSKQNIISPVVGPMARHIDDLITFYKALTSNGMQKIDPYSPPLRFNDDLFKKSSLKIGFYKHLGGSSATPVPAVVRAVEMAKNALEEAGHCVIEFNIPDIDYAVFHLLFKCIFSDGGFGYLKHFIKNNPINDCVSSTVSLLKIPNFIKTMLSYLIRPFNKPFSMVLKNVMGCDSIYNLWELKDKINDYRDMFAKKWIENELDGLLCPVLPFVAQSTKSLKSMSSIVGYTSVYNLLEYPAGTVPVTKVNQDDIDELLSTYPTDTVTHRNIIKYQKDSIGMPVGVQCVSMMWQEETCLRMMKDISEFVK